MGMVEVDLHENVDDGNLGKVLETDYDGMALKDRIIGWQEVMSASGDSLYFVT
jgi:hypothetical protein